MRRLPALSGLLALLACGGQEAPRVTLEVVVDGGEVVAVESDLGWTVTLTRCRGVVGDLAFTTAGEFHDGDVTAQRAPLRRYAVWITRALIPEARAHPGHAAGGEVVGELAGRFVVDFCEGDGASLGAATLTVGDYNGANLSLLTGEEGDGLAADDPLLGHSFELAGVAERDGASVSFHAVIDQDAGREVIGAPFDLDVTEASAAVLGLQLRPRSPFSADTLFDGIDFAALAGAAPEDGDPIELIADEDAANRLKRALQNHDFYFVNPRDSAP
ncbi:MAG: hypothetical protein KC636_11630 [Myxococcales bacterium]|nr:hypothetical protein [Myxococcales bacterium]